MATFNELGLSPSVLRSISNMGFEEATPIQALTIPVALQGKDLIGQAQTGTGKTVAFGIPMIEKIDTASNHIQGIVLAPTRELAVQVSEELIKLGQYTGIKTLPIYGGQDIMRQMRALKKNPHVIVATPGRLIDHINRRTIRLQNIQTLVLDEADEMLNMGFIEEIESILEQIPDERQTLLFSATMPRQIESLAQRYLKNPEKITVKAKEVTVPNIEQVYMEVQEKTKFDVMTRLLDIQSPELAIVFGRTKRRVDELSEALNKRGYSAEGIHGDLTQAKRDSVLRQFKEGTIDILVATDVAARGLDISGVTHVYNFDIPQDPESYVHRIGRTGRAGKTGMAITFVTSREIDHLRMIEQVTKRKMNRRPVPTMTEAIEGAQRITVEKLLSVIGEENYRDYHGLAESLLQENDSVTLVAAALKMLTKEPDITPIRLTEEAPLRSKKRRPFGDDKRGGGPRRGSGDRRSGGSNYRGGRSEGGRRSSDDRRRSSGGKAPSSSRPSSEGRKPRV